MSVKAIIYHGNELKVYDSSHPQMGNIWTDDNGILHIEAIGEKIEIHGVPFSLHYSEKIYKSKEERDKEKKHQIESCDENYGKTLTQKAMENVFKDIKL
jgi:hypothetical protein